MLEVKVITYGGGRPIKAVITDETDKVGIMCIRVGDLGWEPLYGVLAQDDSLIPLPRCFELDSHALNVLNLTK